MAEICDGVRKLIADNIAAKQLQIEVEARSRRSKRIGWAITAACGALAIALFGWQAYDSNEKQQEASSIGAMHAAKDLLDQFLDGYIKGNITDRGSRTLAQLVANFVTKVRLGVIRIAAGENFCRFLRLARKLKRLAGLGKVRRQIGFHVEGLHPQLLCVRGVASPFHLGDEVRDQLSQRA